MTRAVRKAAFCTVLLMAVLPVRAGRILAFDNGLTMQLVEESGWFLGIGEVAIDGVPLRPAQTFADRGAGIGFVDYQYRSGGALAAFPERQGNLRALTEIYPGDRVPAQLDEEHFAAAARWETTPHRYLFLATDEERPEHFWQTRYLEVEQRVRAAVAAELGVRRIMVHNPGWLNGRSAQRGWDGHSPEDSVGGSVNTIYDWRPLPHVESAWRSTHAALQTLGIEYYVWISGFSRRDAPFFRLVGPDPADWASNTPDGRQSPVSGEAAVKHNILSPVFERAFTGRLLDVRREFGYEGFWGDSFQNLFMSQFDWITRDGEPQQRAWWEWLAARTREGLGWISESQSFPGLSCSIETDGWDQHPWLLGHTIKWLRGTSSSAPRTRGCRSPTA